MESFLHEKAQLIFDQNKDDFDDISIIIPNKRAATYLQKHFSSLFKKPFFSPEIRTINEWIDEHTSSRILNSTELLFILFETHQEIETEQAEDFDTFSQWGKILLSDFDEIDRYLISPENIFKNLKEIKDIENWSFDSTELSAGQEKFQNLWDKLIRYYELFNTKLAKANLTYAGKAYAQFLKNLPHAELKKKYYFLGFNAISRSEKEIMAWLKKEKKAEIIFDVDASYYANPSHEAGYFYHKICEEWGIQPQLSDHFNASPKKFEIIETSQQVAQAKIAGKVIADLLKNGADMSKTAIVLADESLLIPVTKSLPPEIEETNITMGYPIKFSHLKGLIDLIFEFQFNYAKFNSDRIYFKSLNLLLQHPYIRLIIQDDEKIAEFQDNLTERNVIFLNLSELIALLPELDPIKALITKWTPDTNERISAFHQLIQVLQVNFTSGTKKETDLELLYQFSKGCKKFTEVWTNYQTTLSLRSFKNLFYQFWQAESLAFLGNPINGLQIMGILETRTIDFENLIILGMNEGSLPKSNVVNSMIPIDLRRFENQLPTEEDRQAIFAHHFYRLIQRAKNITMTYNSHSEGLGGGEQSRFITQLENELDFTKGHEWKRYTHSVENSAAKTVDVVYKTNAEIQLKLDTLLANGLSPSALNKFISCPLDFYYRYIIGLKEDGEIEENIESSTFGTKIHDVLEGIIRDNFFIDDKGSALTISALKAEKKLVNKRLTEAYLNGENGKNFTLEDLKFGQNKLSFDVSEQLILGFLNAQIKEVTESSDAIVPVGLELTDNFYADLEFSVNGIKKPLKIKGTADRIDKKGDLLRIIDYKSGKCDKDKVRIKRTGITGLMTATNTAYGRQLLMYALMFRQQFPNYKKYSAGIISMVNMSDWYQHVGYDDNDLELNENVVNEFEKELIQLISEMYSEGFEFTHNSKALYCEHCGN